MEYRSLLPLWAVFVVLTTHTSVYARRGITNTDDFDEESGYDIEELGSSDPSDNNEPDDEESGSSGVYFPDREGVIARKTVRPLHGMPGMPTGAPNNDIILEQSTRLRSTTTSVYIKGIEIVEDGNSGNEVRIQALSSLLRHPAILAAIIAGAVLTILFITLLVMFLVYRMRKKDEGSYVLDDPKMRIAGIDHHHHHQQSSSAPVYIKAPTSDREFYA